MAEGLRRAGVAVGEMFGRPVEVAQPTIELVDAIALPDHLGDPARYVMALYLGMSGAMSGHFLLIFDAEQAARISDELLGRPADTGASEFSDLGRSALSELANVCASSVLNVLSDHAGRPIVPTPPSVGTDMAGAILDAVVADLLLRGDEALLVRTRMVVSGRALEGTVVLLPDRSSLGALLGRRD